MTAAAQAPPRNKPALQAPSRGGVGGAVDSKACAITRTALQGHPRPAPSQSRSERRRSRLRRGIARFGQWLDLFAVHVLRVAFVTLTVRDADPEAAVGLIEEFWHGVRRHWPRAIYFCVLEVQRRGAVHYHFIWINPPHRREANLVAWIRHSWRAGFVKIKFIPIHRGDRRVLGYFSSYLKKRGFKAYQQDYENVPPQLRTFMHHWLRIPGRVLDAHRDSIEWLWLPASYDIEDDDDVEPVFHLATVRPVAKVTHVCPRDARCVLRDYWRPKRAPRGPVLAQPSSGQGRVSDTLGMTPAQLAATVRTWCNADSRQTAPSVASR